MSDTLIKVENVSKKFCRSLKQSLWYGMQDLGSELVGRPHGGHGQLRPDEFWAVKDVSFEVKRGECLGLIGRNGAGKTTLLKMLNGLIKPDAGRIEIRGRVGALIALGAGFNPVLTGRENIYVNASVLGLKKSEVDARIDKIVDFAELEEFIDSPVQSYSSGMVVRLGFAVAVNTEPEILLLDEVLAVGDVSFQAKCFNTLADLRAQGVAFILVSHNMHQIARYSGSVLCLKQGKASHFLNKNDGIKDYLGQQVRNDEVSEEETDWSKVYGSGKVALTGARFLNGKGEEVSTINSGEVVNLAIDFERRADEVTDFALDVVIRDHEGVVYQGVNQWRELAIGELPLRGTFHVNFGGLPLNSDHADFFLTLIDQKSIEVMDWKRHIRLAINRDKHQLGRLRLTTSWRIASTQEWHE